MGLITLLAQCACMFIASFACGSLPLMFKSASSGRTLKMISVLGMGLLVGAALTIIIPEGVSTVYEALPEGADEGHDSHTTRAIGLALLAGFALMLLIESLMPHPPHSPPSSPSLTPDSPPTPLSPLHHESYSLPAQNRPTPAHINSSTPIMPKSRINLHIRDHDHERDSSGHNHSSKAAAVHGLNATLGLVIHGAADGIALGASSLSGRGSLGLVVFLAVLVHKGPTALGLTTTLMSFQLTHPMIRRRLIIFSCAAPLGAVITYMVVKSFGLGGVGHPAGEVDGLSWWTGIALLFSGGSFLYVATVIQPLSSDAKGSHEESHQPESDVCEEEVGKYTRTGLLIAGMLAPVVLSWIVGDHAH